MLTDISQRSSQGVSGERMLLSRAYGLAPEAEAAIDGADMRELEQHAVRIAVHDSFDWAMGVVADRIRALLLARYQLGNIGKELACDRIIGVARIDQPRHRGGERNCIA